jgi:hypothetical protein
MSGFFAEKRRDASDVFGAGNGNDSIIGNRVGLESLEAALHDDFT